MSEEEEIKKIISQVYVSHNKEFQKQAIDTAARYGKTAITHLLDLNNQVADDEIRQYIMTKVQEIKTKNP
jgi:hypothetical protein